MDSKKFFVQLLLISSLVSVAIFLLNTLPVFSPHALFSWGAVLLFFLLSMAMYYFGSRSASDENKNKFSNTIFGFTFLKLILAAVVISVYFLVVKPESKLFIIPFFVVYFTFTAFETYFMMKIGKANA